MSSWFTRISKGETTSNQIECWRLAQQNDGNANGIYWNFRHGLCQALNNYENVLPWPTSFPDSRSSIKLCIKSKLVGKNVHTFNSSYFYYMNISHVLCV